MWRHPIFWGALGLASLGLLAQWWMFERLSARGEQWAAALSVAAAPLFEPSPRQDAGAPLEIEDFAPLPPQEGEGDEGASNNGARRRTIARLPGVSVGAQRILQLAKDGAVPRGQPVARRGAQPRGVAVVGVSALGLGVQDGDVITRVAGVPVSSRGQIVRLVTAAHEAKAPAISAEVWRGQRPFSLVVELPRLDSAGNLHQEGGQDANRSVRQVGQGARGLGQAPVQR